MASELKVDKFTGVTTAGSISVTGEGNSTTTNLQQGLAKQWVTYNASQAITDSLNTSTITDVGTGNHKYNFTNNFRAAQAYTTGGVMANTADDTTPYSYMAKPMQDDDITTASVECITVYVSNGSGGFFDYAYSCSSSHGDLA
jgi:hypothetical protein